MQMILLGNCTKVEGMHVCGISNRNLRGKTAECVLRFLGDEDKCKVCTYSMKKEDENNPPSAD